MGSINSTKLFKLLFGDFVNTFACEFLHSDSGIVFGLDYEKKIVIESLEELSPSSEFSILTNGLRLLKINDENILDFGFGFLALKKVRKIITKINKNKIKFEFLEPTLSITKFSNILDIEIDNKIYSLKLPVGAVYDMNRFALQIQENLNRRNYPLSSINFNMSQKKKQVHISVNENDMPFRLLFASGPNSQCSVRFIFGFSAEDLPYSFSHHGHCMTIELNLRLSEDESHILVNELFLKFDQDRSNDLNFEEFRAFYVKLLDNDECLDLLRRFAKYQFRNIIQAEFWAEDQVFIIYYLRPPAINMNVFTI